jgi:hypothetical protein
LQKLQQNEPDVIILLHSKKLASGYPHQPPPPLGSGIGSWTLQLPALRNITPHISRTWKLWLSAQDTSDCA